MTITARHIGAGVLLITLFIFPAILSAAPHKIFAKATSYARRFHGRKTASGEIYNRYGYTAAHRKYPFGTRLKITNPKNGSSCIITVNDRGPYSNSADLDLSEAASRQIACNGPATVIVEKLD